jgi:hypothetical protein
VDVNYFVPCYYLGNDDDHDDDDDDDDDHDHDDGNKPCYYLGTVITHRWSS